ncbi:Flp family type IVb pilin [Geomonas azotofigens]|uniref:Flp family type IVb pilin n=1 Tax=Geomonas azotofigens TaxID=2843196 RepID=UPI001C121391|nr:Flp family type IVb pilin [Geomonas azotofigens]MBU5614648.1 Flp family type IVb pilin [Geomonas azotofigens]
MFEKLKRTGKKMKDALKSNRGQGLVEYALILVLIAIVVILAVRTLGTTTRSIFQNVNTELTK